jgi:hypothetical protein
MSLSINHYIYNNISNNIFNGVCEVVGYYIESLIDNNIYKENETKKNIEVIIVKTHNHFYYSIRLITLQKESWTSWIESFGYIDVKPESSKVISKITHYPIYYFEININDLNNTIYDYTCDFFSYSHIGDNVEEVSFGYAHIHYYLFTIKKPNHIVLHQLKMKFLMDELIKNIMHPDNINYLIGLDLGVDF